MATIIGAIDEHDGCRTILFDLEEEISRHYEGDSIFPSPVMVEQDANGWWAAVKKTIQMAIKNGKVDPKILSRFLLPTKRDRRSVDAKARLCITPCLQDRRTTAQCEMIKDKISVDKIYNTTV